MNNLSRDVDSCSLDFLLVLFSIQVIPKKKGEQAERFKGIKTFGQITAVNKIVWVAICMAWEPQFWSQNCVKVDSSPTERESAPEMPLWESLSDSGALDLENVLSQFITFTVTRSS